MVSFLLFHMAHLKKAEAAQAVLFLRGNCETGVAQGAAALCGPATHSSHVSQPASSICLRRKESSSSTSAGVRIGSRPPLSKTSHWGHLQDLNDCTGKPKQAHSSFLGPLEDQRGSRGRALLEEDEKEQGEGWIRAWRLDVGNGIAEMATGMVGDCRFN